MLYEIRLTARCIGAAAAVSALALALTAEPVRAQGGGTTDRWAPIGPPGADYIRVLAVDPLNPTTIYASAYNFDSIFRSTDGGNSWTELPPLVPRGIIHVLAIDPQTPTTLYAGWVNGFDGRVFKSTDGGASWISTGGAWGGIGGSNALVINPRTPATVYLGQFADPPSHSGVYKTTDGGATWTAAKVGLPSSGVSTLAIDPQVPDTLYAGSNGAVFKTVDGGASWVMTGLANGIIDWLVIDPTRPATLYAGVREGSSSWTVYRTIDAGISWIPFQNGLPSPVTAFVVDPHDPTALYAATASGVFKSGDGGTSWTAMNDGLTHVATELAIDGLTPATLYAGTSGGGAFALRITPRHTLSLQRMGDGVGLVTSSPAGISCGNDCTELFREGTVVTLSAVPGPGSRFTAWSGCDAVEEDGDCSVTMDGVRNVIATFDRQLVGLTVSTSGFRGGTVTSSPDGIDCGSDCSEWFAIGTVVTLTATPERGVVARWNGCDSDSGPGLTSTCTVTMTAGRSVTTTFRPKQKKSKHEPHGH